MKALALLMLALLTHVVSLHGIGGNNETNGLDVRRGSLVPLLSTLISIAPPVAAAFFQALWGS